MFENFSDVERRAIVLAQAYETARRKKQFGYKCFATFDASIKNTSVMKQFITVVNWLDKEGWRVTWNEVDWQGYVQYIFDTLAPTIPQPGQLKQGMFIKKYIKGSYFGEGIQLRDDKQLTELYGSILDPEIINDDKLLKGLGLCTKKSL